MRGPLGALWNTRLVGTYLRLRLAGLLAGILAVAAAVLLLGVGGIPGLVALFTLVVLLFVIVGLELVVR